MNEKFNIEQEIIQITNKALKAAIDSGEIIFDELPPVQIEVPKDEKFGDFSVNIAMQLAKKAGMNPRTLAGILIEKMDLNATYITKAEIAGPGFINFFLNDQWLYDELADIIRQKNDYGKIILTEPKSINVEYVSANPTGPLHIGNARGGAIGDVLANIYHWAGWNVTKEFYLNDAGNQIIKFGESLSSRYMQLFDKTYPFPEDGYQGDDIKTLAADYKDKHGDILVNCKAEEREKILTEYGLKINIENMKTALNKYGIRYDVWFNESSLHNSDAIDNIINILSQNGATYEKDGALWFKATDYDCEKDEVLLRNNGIPTYFTADIAYHYNKLMIRKFDLAVNVWGADHHGHVHRLKMALGAAGIEPERLQVILMQLVHVIRGDETVRLSKRKGEIITLSDLIDEVSIDAARFIFNYYNANTHMDFDLDLAVKESNENPVFYVQYAHARIKSILRNVQCDDKYADYILLKDKTEIALIKKMAEFSKEIITAARDLDPSRITKYAYDLATHFHSFYNACRVICDDKFLMRARIDLVTACGYLLKSALNILGVNAPEQM